MALTVDKSDLQKALWNSKDKGQFQRVLCVWLKVLFSLSSREIAYAIGWKPSSVRNVQARFQKEGMQCFAGKRKGGRRRANMSLDREGVIIEKFARHAKRGFRLDVKQIQKAYELSVGRPVSLSTIYRLIARHGLRRFLPRVRSA
jgi:transposase